MVVNSYAAAALAEHPQFAELANSQRDHHPPSSCATAHCCNAGIDVFQRERALTRDLPENCAAPLASDI